MSQKICWSCSLYYKEKSEFVKHMKKHCMFCDVLCESVNDLELHLENHHGDEHVMKQNRDQQQEKLKQQHENKSAVKVEKFCDDCDKIVNNIRSEEH